VSQHWNPDGEIARVIPLHERATRRAWPAGATAGLVLVAAACAGTVAGLYQAAGPRNPVEPEAKIERSAAPAAPADAMQAAPEAQAGAADAQWEGAQVIEAGLPRRFAARNDGVRASFGYCKWGGGTNCVVDGDTFWIGGDKVRIAGIDAPETHDYRCASELALGDRATETLHALLNSGAVTMTVIEDFAQSGTLSEGRARDRDRYGRLLRNVAVDGADVGEAMVGAGVAREYAGGRRPWC
jgi:endonuclease YncB( thermonuclease family)